MNELRMKAEELVEKANEQIERYGCMLNQICVNKTVNVSPFDKQLEKAIKEVAAEKGLEVLFESHSHKVTRIHGYTPIGNRPVTSSYVNRWRTMFACKM